MSIFVECRFNTLNDLEIDVYNDFFLSKYLKKVLQALRRLKGNSDRKPKMSTETKIVFDQLTEDAMKLMENGEYS